MKQKMLGGAALVMTASVNSFASAYGDKKDKIDLSEIGDLGPLGDIEVGKTDNAKHIKNFKKDTNNNADILAAVKKIKDTSTDVVIYEGKVDGGISTEFKPKYLKVAVEDKKISGTPAEIKNDVKIDAGSYFFVTKSKDDEIKIEIKNVKEKSKFSDEKGTFKKDE